MQCVNPFLVNTGGEAITLPTSETKSQKDVDNYFLNMEFLYHIFIDLSKIALDTSIY